MMDSSYFLLRQIECGFEDGVLRLRGCVPSFYLKQLVQTLVCDIECVTQIDNQVDVVNPRGLSSDPRA